MSRTDKGMVFNIQRLSVNDGPGIRTTVFLKGCPLHCLWCHNPESRATRAELSFSEKRCVGCGRCLHRCGLHCHRMDGGKHTVDRSRCIACGKCAGACAGALEIIGREMTCGEVLAEVCKDRKFYAESGGGITVSGGEPLYHFLFTRALLTEAKAMGLHTCVETSGYADFDKLADLMKYVDLFLYDWKETDDALHKKFTGVSNKKIYENLLRLDEAGAAIILRCPVIPGYNDRKEHLDGIADLANQLKNIAEINIQPYHPLGRSKYDSLGYACALPAIVFPPEAEVKMWLDHIRGRTEIPVKKA